MTGFQAERCTCGHVDGDHVVVKTGGLRPAVVGLCKINGCPCKRFVLAETTGTQAT